VPGTVSHAARHRTRGTAWYPTGWLSHARRQVRNKTSLRDPAEAIRASGFARARDHERRKKQIRCFRYQESRGAPLPADHDPEEVRRRLDERGRRNREAVHRNREAVHRNREAVRRNREAVRRNREAVRRSHAAGPMVGRDRTRLAEQRELIATERHRRKGRVGRRAHVRLRVGRRVRRNLRAEARTSLHAALGRCPASSATLPPNRAYTMRAKAAGAPSANRQPCSFRGRASFPRGPARRFMRGSARPTRGRSAVKPYRLRAGHSRLLEDRRTHRRAGRHVRRTLRGRHHRTHYSHASDVMHVVTIHLYLR
jgi:hypothetical protein